MGRIGSFAAATAPLLTAAIDEPGCRLDIMLDLAIPAGSGRSRVCHNRRRCTTRELPPGACEGQWALGQVWRGRDRVAMAPTPGSLRSHRAASRRIILDRSV